MERQAINTIAHAYARKLYADAQQDEQEQIRANEFMAGAMTAISNLCGSPNAADLLISGYNMGRGLFEHNYKDKP